MKAVLREFVFPLPTGTAALRVPFPLTEEDYDLLIKTLRNFKEGLVKKDFPQIDLSQRKPWYNPDGDCIVYHTVDEATVAERVDDVLTVYKSTISGKAIGFQLKGVGAIMRALGGGAVEVECEECNKEIRNVSMSALLLTAYEIGPKTIGRRKAYVDALEFSPRQTSLTINPVTF